MPLTVMFIPRYEVTSSRREVTQKVELEVELADGMVVLSIGRVALSIGMVEFMVELATNGSVLLSAHVPVSTSSYSRLEADELSNERVHADDILDIGTRNIKLGQIRVTSRREVLSGGI